MLEDRLPRPTIANTKVRHDGMELMRILVGMSLLLTAYGGQVFAPHLTASGGAGTALVFLQALIGILLISNHFLHYAAVLLAGFSSVPSLSSDLPLASNMLTISASRCSSISTTSRTRSGRRA
ncbi:MAG: hypothetical protein QNJ20_03915 [Paracoccaceae bacterium]|nr:hypothetical protein [Paracoccaceae bacterium]